MASRTSESAKARARASRDIEDIEVLRKNPAFHRYFERRVLSELESARNELLYGKDLTPEKLWNFRLKFDALYGVSLMLLQDEAACRNLIGESTDED